MDTGATKMFVSRELICQAPDHQVVKHVAADILHVQLPNGDEVQSKGKVKLEANVEKLQVTFKAHIPNTTKPLVLGIDF